MQQRPHISLKQAQLQSQAARKARKTIFILKTWRSVRKQLEHEGEPNYLEINGEAARSSPMRQQWQESFYLKEC
jgi:hypothetical protein